MLKEIKLVFNHQFFIFSIFLLGISDFSFASHDFHQLFDMGIKANQTKEWDKAISDFSQALSLEPTNSATLNNLAYSYFQKGNKGRALSLYRKVLYLHPENQTAKAGLSFALQSLEVKEIPHQIEAFEILRDYFLIPMSIYHYLFLALLTIFLSLWLGFQYIGEKSRSASKTPNTKTLIFVVSFIILSLICSTLLGLKYLDLKTVRGTVVDPQTVAYISPGENQVEAFTLYEGFEVIIRRQKDDWYQVTYPGGIHRVDQKIVSHYNHRYQSVNFLIVIDLILEGPIKSLTMFTLFLKLIRASFRNLVPQSHVRHKNIQFLTFFIFFISLSSCTTPEKNIDTPEKAFAVAEEYEKAGTFEQAIKKYQDLKNKFPYSHFAIKAELAIADIHYKNESYAESQVHYLTFKDLHPTFPRIDYVTYQIGMSYFKQLPSSIDRDLTLANDAIRFFDELIYKYPQSEYKKDSELRRSEALKMQTQKEEYIADFYFKQENYLSALMRYEEILNKFQGSFIESKALARAALSAKKVGDLNKVKLYRNRLINEFPKDKDTVSAIKELN